MVQLKQRQVLGGCLLLGVLVWAGCGDRAPLSSRTAEPGAAKLTVSGTKAGGWGRYLDAIGDARTAEASEVADDLVAILPSNEYLVWDQGRVLAVTWTSWPGYNSLVGSTIATTRLTWVTAVPQVIDFCRDQGLAVADRTLRLEQLMGLPPNNGKTFFVELWVDPADLFRPSPDPEITDTTAGLVFAANGDQLHRVSADSVVSHRAWFENLRRVSYTEGTGGFPWTRLGYTYDWARGSEEGMSEFVLQAGAQVTVAAVVGTLQYCQ